MAHQVGRVRTLEMKHGYCTNAPMFHRYPAEVASWTPADELSDPAKLIESFELTAKTEGVALSYSSPLSLLHEAVDAGWGVKEI